MKDLIAWFDMETTGLDPKDHQVLEVALVMTDWDLNPLGSGYTSAVRYSIPTARALKNKATDYVREMHERTGLWDRIQEPSARPLASVSKDLYDYLKLYAPQERQARMGGNSIMLDMGFAREYFPDFTNHLHYRVLDMSSVQEAATQWFDVPVFEKRLQHSALDDIMESLEQARYIKRQLDNRLS